MTSYGFKLYRRYLHLTLSPCFAYISHGGQSSRIGRICTLNSDFRPTLNSVPQACSEMERPTKDLLLKSQPPSALLSVAVVVGRHIQAILATCTAPRLRRTFLSFEKV
jgi:hypothetical protein